MCLVWSNYRASGRSDYRPRLECSMRSQRNAEAIMNFEKYRDCGLAAIWETWLTTAAAVAGVYLSLYLFTGSPEIAAGPASQTEHCHQA